MLMLLMVIMSFLLGFIRDITIAWRYGGGWLADALFVCLVVPVFFENILGIAIRDGVIAFIGRSGKDGSNISFKKFNLLQRYLWLLALAVTGAIWSGAGVLLPIISPGWNIDQIGSGIFPFKMASLLVFVQTILYFQTGILNSAHKFILPMWRTVLLNAGAILALVYFPESLSGIIIGMIAGQVVLMAVQQKKILTVVNHHIRSMGVSGERGGKVDKGITGYVFPIILAAVLQQLCIIAEKFFGSMLQAGSIAYLTFAFRIATIPLTIFSLSFLTVLYPNIAPHLNRGGDSNLIKLKCNALNICLMVIVPAALVLISQPHLIIMNLLERGEFGISQTYHTAPLLAIYAAGVPGMGIALLGGRFLLANGQGRLFLASSLVLAISVLVLDALLYKDFGANGLAISFTIGSWAQALYITILVFTGAMKRHLVVLFIRWVCASAITYLVLILFPADGRFIFIPALYLCSLLIHLCVIFLLGEKSWIKKDFWRFDARDSVK